MGRKALELGYMALVCTAVLAGAFWLLADARRIGPLIGALGFLPLLAGRLAGVELKRMVPDLIFGALDTGLLTIPALLGASFYGVAGAIVGGVVGDALTDAIAGFFEGGVAEWLRRHGIEESRLPLSSGLGKMSGCLLGAGGVLTLAMFLGVGVERFLFP